MTEIASAKAATAFNVASVTCFILAAATLPLYYGFQVGKQESAMRDERSAHLNHELEALAEQGFRTHNDLRLLEYEVEGARIDAKETHRLLRQLRREIKAQAPTQRFNQGRL